MGNLQREEEILAILKEKNYVTVDYLAKSVHSSPSSIRRDLSSLEAQGIVRRSHGGASLLSAEPGMAPFSFRLHEYKKEKISMIRRASSLITQDTSIFVDGSTTTVDIYRYITPAMNLTVFTNNIQLAHLLAARKIKSYCVGGRVSEHNNVITTGSYALSMLEGIHVDQFFFTSSAFSEDGMITDLNEEETAIRKMVLDHAATNIFLCHHSRFPTRATFGLADLSKIDYVISDFTFAEEFRSSYPDTTFFTTD